MGFKLQDIRTYLCYEVSPDFTLLTFPTCKYDKGDGNSDQTIMRVKEIAIQRGWPLSHMSLAWLNRRVTAPILGFSSSERIYEALGARGKLLTDEEESYLEGLYWPRSVQGHA